MTLGEFLESGIIIEGCLKIQCFEPGDKLVVYYEGEDTNNLSSYEDREIVYMYPYIRDNGEAGLCIELSFGDTY